MPFIVPPTDCASSKGDVVEVETPHPRAAALQLVERLDGLRLDRVRAVGKNLLLDFEGGLVLRSHLRMRGRWRVESAGHEPLGMPWLVLRGRAAPGGAVERPCPGADARTVAHGGAARTGHHERPARPCRHALAPPRRPAVARGRRGPPRPAARCGDREHVEGRGALRRPGVSVAPARRVGRRRAQCPARRCCPAHACGPQASSGVPASRASLRAL